MKTLWAVQVLTAHDSRPDRVADQTAKNRASCDTDHVGPFPDIDEARAWIEVQGEALATFEPREDEIIPDHVNRRRTADGRFQVVEINAGVEMIPPEV